MKGLKEEAVAFSRKVPPKLVEWAQSRILHKLNQLLGQSSRITIGTSVNTDTDAVATNDVRNSEIISAIENNSEILRRIETQLSFLTDVQLDKGDVS